MVTTQIWLKLLCFMLALHVFFSRLNQLGFFLFKFLKCSLVYEWEKQMWRRNNGWEMEIATCCYCTLRDHKRRYFVFAKIYLKRITWVLKEPLIIKHWVRYLSINENGALGNPGFQQYLVCDIKRDLWGRWAKTRNSSWILVNRTPGAKRLASQEVGVTDTLRITIS